MLQLCNLSLTLLQFCAKKLQKCNFNEKLRKRNSMAGNRKTALKNLEKARGKGGRPKGQSPATKLKKQMFAVVDQLGGMDWLREQVAEKDPVAYTKIMASLIPKERVHDIKSQVSVVIQADPIKKE